MKCEICSYEGELTQDSAHGPYGRCPECGSLESTRTFAVALFDVADTRRFQSDKFLRLDPPSGNAEDLLARGLERKGYQYTTTMPNDGVRCDLRDLSQFADGALAAVFCTGVLEQVVDDRTAIREIARVLEPGGALVSETTPGATESTFSGFAAQESVRVCGLDYVDRYLETGLFDLERIRRCKTASGNGWIYELRRTDCAIGVSSVFTATKLPRRLGSEILQEQLTAGQAVSGEPSGRFNYKILSRRLVNLKRDPKQYCADSRFGVVRRIGRYL